MGWLVTLVVLFVVGYLVSLRLHPFRKCPACNGTGRHFGGFYTNSQRRCSRCGGGSRQERLGTRLGLGGNREKIHGIRPNHRHDPFSELVAHTEGWPAGPGLSREVRTREVRTGLVSFLPK